MQLAFSWVPVNEGVSTVEDPCLALASYSNTTGTADEWLQQQ